MTPFYDNLVKSLKSLPGLGYKSAEKIALHLLVEKPNKLLELSECLLQSSQNLGPCKICGNLTEKEECKLCTSPDRNASLLCLVETVMDLHSIERAGIYNGRYHVLQGKLSPLRGIGPEQLNLESLRDRMGAGAFHEVILALGNDLEGEATCNYLKQEIFADISLKVTRIGFGLPSGAVLTYADETTLKNSLEGRKSF